MRSAEADPDEIVFFTDMECFGASAGRWRLRRVRGDVDALAGGIVLPTMIRADEAVILRAPAGKLCATMKAKVLPSVDALAAAPEDDAITEEADRADVTWM